jgi:HD-GYP domain-containing protein (c-di-GMP phosphodiesterase class II)
LAGGGLVVGSGFWQRDGTGQLHAIALLTGLGLAGAIGYSVHPGLALPILVCCAGSCAVVILAARRVAIQKAVACGALTSTLTAIGIAFLGSAPVALSLTAASLLLLAMRPDYVVVRGDWRSTSRLDRSKVLRCLVDSLANATAVRDARTSEHCERVARNAVVIGEFLGLPSEDLIRLEWAARLHDVGKMAVPRSVLMKPGPLTPGETKAVRKHSSSGADLLRSASGALGPIAHIVRHHHENWDGTGYPAGLRGEAIPLESRIIAVVDVYEALTSDRPYRPKVSDTDVHREILSGAGSRFDPDVVIVFDELWRKRCLTHMLSRDHPARLMPLRTPGGHDPNSMRGTLKQRR